MKSLFAAVCLIAWSGAIASASPVAYDAVLSGAAQSPPVVSPATGFAAVVFDLAAHSLFISVTFQDLLGPDTASHIHCCTAAPETGNAGVATITPTFTGFPSGVTSGSYTHTFDTSLASAWNPSFVTAHGGISGAEAAFAAGLASGEAYLNIHSSVFPGGEIRGFLEPAPEPATIVLGGAALLGLLGLRHRATHSPESRCNRA